MRHVYFATNRNKKGRTDFGKRFSKKGVSDLRFGRAEEVDDGRTRVIGVTPRRQVRRWSGAS